MRLFFSTLIMLMLAACSRANDHRAQGYIEGDYLYIGPQVADASNRLPLKKALG